MTPSQPNTESKKAEHTPGPWTLKPCSNGGMILVRGDGTAQGHVQSHLQIVPNEDARLIAAAPDMLAALQDAKREIEWLCEQSTLRFNIVKTRQAYLNILAAIAKAEAQ